MDIDKYVIMCSKIGDMVLSREIDVYEAETLESKWQLYYKEYDPDSTELFYKDGMLFLIPQESGKPIKVIIA